MNLESDRQYRRGAKTNLDIKIVPDVLCPADIASTDADGVVLYFYGFTVECKFERTSRCQSCNPHLIGLNQAGIALRRPLTEEQLECPMQLCMRKVDPLVVRIYPIGGVCSNSGRVCGVDLAQMQRYHRACLCNESESTGDAAANSWMALTKTSNSTFEIPDDRACPATAAEWVSSSNGAWYVLFPQPVSDADRSRPLFDRSINASCVLSNWWSRYFADVAQEAQILIHNLRVQLHVNQDYINKSTSSAEASQESAISLPTPTLNLADEEVKTPDELSGLLISRGPGPILHILPGNGREGFQRITDAMALVPAERVLGLQQGISVPHRLKISPGQDLIVFQAACESLRNTTITSSTCGIAEVQAGCDGRKVLDLNGTFYAAWTYGDHYAAKGLLSKTRIEAIIKELGGNLLVDEVQEFDPPSGSHRMVLALTAPRQLRLTELLSFPDSIDAEIMAETLATTAAIEKTNARETGVDEGTKLEEPLALENDDHSHSNPIYLLPEVCRPLGQARHFFIGLAIGSCVWRLESILVAHEARAFVLQALAESLSPGKTRLMGPATPSPDGNLGRHIVTSCVDREGRWMEYSFSDENGIMLEETYRVCTPPLSVIIEALTPRMTCDLTNSGRLELLGDCVLKAYSAVELFLNETKLSEGAMTEGRKVITNNHFMADFCEQIGLSRFLRPMSLSGGSLFLLHRPPGITEQALNDGRSAWSASFVVEGEGVSAAVISNQQPAVEGKKKKKKKKKSTTTTTSTEENISPEEIDTTPSGEVLPNFPQHLRSVVPRKYLADVVEAVIGAFFDSGGWVVGVGISRVLLNLNEPCTRIDKFRKKKYASEQSKAAARNAVSLFGGCKCGNVRYVARGLPHDLLVCHCSMCLPCDRTFSHPLLGKGAPWVAVSRLETEPSGLQTFRSSSYTSRARCKKCNQAIYKRYDYEQDTDWVALGSLMDRNTVQASLQERHVYCGIQEEDMPYCFPGKEPFAPDPCKVYSIPTHENVCCSCWQLRESCKCNVFTPMVLQPHYEVATRPVFREVRSGAMTALCKALNYQFHSAELLEAALTHSSVLGAISNQRLEFLGDAVIDIGVVSHLFKAVIQAQEGDLSEARASCVSNVYLSKIAIHRVGVHKWIKCGSVELRRNLDALKQNEESIVEYWSPQAILDRRVAGQEILEEEYFRLMEQESIPAPTAVHVHALSSLSWWGVIYNPWQTALTLISVLKELLFGPEAPKMTIVPAKKCVGVHKACADALEAVYGAMYLDSNGSIEILQKSMLHVGILHPRAIEEALARRRHRDVVERRYVYIRETEAARKSQKKDKVKPKA